METAWVGLLLTITRLASMFVSLPFISYRGVPNLLKIFFAVAVSYLLFQNLSLYPDPAVTLTTFNLLLAVGSEAIIGLTIGLIVLLFFSVFRMAGQLIDLQIGLSLANLFDPQFGTSITLLSQFYYLFAIVVYFAFDGHHHLFVALARSFELIPPGASIGVSGTAAILLESFYYLFMVAFQIAAPVTATVLITDIALGLLSKTVPQLHVFLVGLPLKIFLGLLVVYLTLPYLSALMATVFDRLNSDILKILVNMI